MKRICGASTFCERVTDTRSWGGFDVSLVFDTGAPAPTRHYLVDKLPQHGLCSTPENVVFHGCQHIPLAGCADLQSGDLVGVASAHLLRVPVSAL